MPKDKTNQQNINPYLSTGEAARILGITPEAVWQNVSTGRIPAIRVGRNWIIPRDELLVFAKTFVKGLGRRKRTDR